ncbi:MAG: hypothetical protein H0W79_06915 [Rubrobacteraceae bacterium]|nr:hypothetical protein [Rubrobacteraceae bacterium]
MQRLILRTLLRKLSLGLGALVLHSLLPRVLLHVKLGRETGSDDAHYKRNQE